MFAGFLAGILAFTLLEWAAAAVFLLFLIISIATYSHEKYGPSFFTMVVSLVGIGFIFKSDLLSYVATTGLVLAIAKPVIGYLIIGIIVSFVNWIFYCMHAKTKYRNLVLITLNDTVAFAAHKAQVIKRLFGGDATATVTDDFARKVLQLQVVSRNQNEIFGHAYSVRSVPSYGMSDLEGTTVESATAYIDQTMANVLPPRALRGKVILSSAVFEWPITILSLVFSRILTVLVDKLVFISRKLVDKVSHLSFGSTDIAL
jgi:hypothetical protein